MRSRGFNLIFEKAIPENTVLLLSDITGRIILEEKLIQGETSHLVLARNLTKGVYVAKVLENGVQKGVKVVIVK